MNRKNDGKNGRNGRRGDPLRCSMQRRGRLAQQRLIYVVGEGELTEREYALILRKEIKGTFRLNYASPSGHHGGSAAALVKTARALESDHPSSKEASTDFWILADVEAAGKAHDLRVLFEWVSGGENRHLGLTNEQFENYLLLHFRRSMSSQHPERDLAAFIPGYGKANKRIGGRIGLEQIVTALNNAKASNVLVGDRPTQAQDVPRYSTSVPHLVRELMELKG